jgi:PKD repeat protein
MGYQLEPLSVVFKPSANSICRGASVTFQPFSNGSPTSYQWTFEGGTPASWTGPLPTITYETAGKFPVSLTVSDGSTSNTFSMNNLITVDNCIGIEEAVSKEFVIYPNPAVDRIVITTSGKTKQMREVMIADLQGRVLLLIDPGESTTELSVPLSGLLPGMYLVVIRGDTWSETSKLVIK